MNLILKNLKELLEIKQVQAILSNKSFCSTNKVKIRKKFQIFLAPLKPLAQTKQIKCHLSLNIALKILKKN